MERGPGGNQLVYDDGEWIIEALQDNHGDLFFFVWKHPAYGEPSPIGPLHQALPLNRRAAILERLLEHLTVEGEVKKFYHHVDPARTLRWLPTTQRRAEE